MLTITVKKNYDVDGAIDFTFDGNQSDLSGLSSDEEEMMRSKMKTKQCFR